jgi:hypothetical protein
MKNFIERPIARAVELDWHFVADEWLARAIDVVQQLKETLTFEFR